MVGCCPTAPTHVCTEINQRTFTVERIMDGDTFKVQYDGESTSVRIAGIDAPERRGADGPAATAALSKLIYTRTVRLEFTGKRKRDNIGRLLCRVYVGDLDVGAEMIRLGHAAPYRKLPQ